MSNLVALRGLVKEECEKIEAALNKLLEERFVVKDRGEYKVYCVQSEYISVLVVGKTFDSVYMGIENILHRCLFSYLLNLFY